MTGQIVLINGDGIGGEVIPAAREVLRALDLPLSLVTADAGYATFERTGSALPAATLATCEAADAILFGATQSPMTRVAGYSSPILALRRHFDLYANLRPAKSDGVDMLIVRENTEGLYSQRETIDDAEQCAVAERIITRAASERIVRQACEQAQTRRGKLTIVHKANVLKLTCGLFRDVAFDVCAEYPAVRVDEMLVDAAAMRIVMQPEQFDVIVTTNLFGDILSDVAAGVTGGLGMAPSASIGSGTPVFEPVHGSAPDIAGQGIADPRAAILSAAMLLGHLGYRQRAAALERITRATPHTGRTSDTVQAIITEITQQEVTS